MAIQMPHSTSQMMFSMTRMTLAAPPVSVLAPVRPVWHPPLSWPLGGGVAIAIIVGPGVTAGSAGAGDVGCDDLPAADGVGPGVVLGGAGAVVDYHQVEPDPVAGLAQPGGLLGARAGVSGHELLEGLLGRQGRADQRPCLGVLVGVDVPVVGTDHGPGTATARPGPGGLRGGRCRPRCAAGRAGAGRCR